MRLRIVLLEMALLVHTTANDVKNREKKEQKQMLNQDFGTQIRK